MRPRELSDDFTSTNEVVKHALQWLKERNELVQYACCVYATAPMIQPKYLKEGLESLVSSGKNYVFTATTFGFPIQRAIKCNSLGAVEPFFPEKISSRSQDLEQAYHDAGQFYWGKSEAYFQEAPVFSSGSLALILPRYLVQDIDTEEDWLQAEIMYKALHASGVVL
jgi:N-acylneuraminate cytidylyltransferase